MKHESGKSSLREQRSGRNRKEKLRLKTRRKSTPEDLRPAGWGKDRLKSLGKVRRVLNPYSEHLEILERRTYTITELAAAFHVTRVWVHALIRAGVLPPPPFQTLPTFPGADMRAARPVYLYENVAESLRRIVKKTQLRQYIPASVWVEAGEALKQRMI